MRTLMNRAAAGLTVISLVAGSLFGTGGIALADTTRPNAPANLILDPAETTVGPVELTWTAPTNESIAYYEVFRFIGTGRASASVVTYLGQVPVTDENREDETFRFADTIPTEGTFQYAVIAVDDDGQASLPSAWASILVDMEDDDEITLDRTAPGVPRNLNLGAAFTNDREISLTWDLQEEEDLWRYLIYRADNNGDKRLLGYVEGTDNQFGETLTADGSYIYSVVAQDETGNISAYSAGKRIEVDTLNPVVRITTPVEGRTYSATGQLSIAVTIQERGVGYHNSAVEYYLDDLKLAGPSIDLATLTSGNHTVTVIVTDKAGNVGTDENLFVVNNAQNLPGAPQSLTTREYHKTREVSLSWSTPQNSTISSYLVYRTRAGETAELVTTTANRSFTDTVPADGVYSYHVVARHANGTEVSSLPVITTVDTAAPTITIRSPQNRSYTATGTVAVTVNAVDATSGVQTVRYSLDNESVTGTSINLANLENGAHTFKVEATDRAGNKAVRSVSFSVTGSTSGDDDDDDDDDDSDGRPARNTALANKLTSLWERGEISKGHYTALMAFTRNGNMMAFRKHLEKFGGTKQISSAAAEELWEILGGAPAGQGKGPGNGKKPKKQP